MQSPATAPDAVTAAVRGWMAGFRAELLQLAQDSLDSHKQVCTAAAAATAGFSSVCMAGGLLVFQAQLL